MEERWLLCVDPDSKHIYTLNTNTQEVHIETSVDQEYLQKAHKTIIDMEKLLQLNTGNWFTVSRQVEKYRRRPIPSYLFQKQSSTIPVYMSQSTLSLAFSNVSTIKLRFKLTYYRAQLPPMAPAIVEMDAGLVTSSNEVIKNLLRYMFKEYQVKLKPKTEENQFVMQVSGFKEYLTGSQPILQFDRVRIALRGMKFLEVILTEVPRHNESVEKFPPIIIRRKGQFPPIDWAQYKDIPMLFWYPPFKIPSLINNNIQDESWEKRKDQKILDSLLGKAIKPNDNEINQIVQQLYKKFKAQSVQKINDIIYSGESDFPFKINLMGIDNLNQVFEQDLAKLDKLRATYNGIMPLQFITKKDAKPEEQHNTAKKKEKSSSVDGKPKKQMPLRLRGKDAPPGNEESTIKTTAYGGHVPRYLVDRFMTTYKLDFVPYLISVRVGCYHGENLLTQWSQVESKAVPFSLQPRFNQEIRFPGIRISSLPLESKLCFDIIIHSFTGQRQIIGSSYLYIFDEDMMYRHGISQLNIWPFCKVDPRLSCMNQYWGLRSLDRPTDLHSFVQSEYGRLLVKIDEFSAPVRWSLRDPKTMEKYGFPKHSKTNEHYIQTLKYNPDLVKLLIHGNRHGIAKESLKKLKTQMTTLANKRKGFVIQGQNSTVIDAQPHKDRSRHRSTSAQSQLQRSISQLSTSQNTKEESLFKFYPYKDWNITPTTGDLAYMQTLMNCNPLVRVNHNEHDRFTMLICRKHYKTITHALQILLMSLDWSDPDQVREAHEMLKQWSPLTPEDALPLIDATLADEQVRLYAVERLSELSDDELALYMLEFTQALMFEKSVLNPLAEMLLERSLQNPWVVGHELFWLLRSQLHVKPSYERFALILEQLLMLSGSFRQDLLNEVLVNDEINNIADNIKKQPKEQQLPYLRENIINIRKKFPRPFSFALDARMEAHDFKPEKCKVLDSKKLPLWLVTTTQDDDILEDPSSQEQKKSEVIMIIFKNGDDIRQDLLTLQLIKIMDKIWLDAGMDFRMKPYKVIATMDQVGMIEVVRNSETMSKIHHDAGSLGAFESKSIWYYLNSKNPTEQSLQIAIDNFLRSCAGYCVATYILGIGDRHSGNIMLSETGHLFHIDFGHFLGNFKSKFGFKRERAPFVFTTEMAYVMGGKDGKLFKQFEEYCTGAYNMVRKHGRFLINIFLMNLSAGMPELQEASDVKYLQDQLDLTLSDQEATTKFRQQINSSLSDQWRQIDNFIHNIKRKG